MFSYLDYTKNNIYFTTSNWFVQKENKSKKFLNFINGINYC